MNDLTPIRVPRRWEAAAELLLGSSLAGTGTGMGRGHPPAEHLSAPWVASVELLGSRPAVRGLETSAVQGRCVSPSQMHLPASLGLSPANTRCRIFPKAGQVMEDPFKADAAE